MVDFRQYLYVHKWRNLFKLFITKIVTSEINNDYMTSGYISLFFFSFLYCKEETLIRKNEQEKNNYQGGIIKHKIVSNYLFFVDVSSRYLSLLQG